MIAVKTARFKNFSKNFLMIFGALIVFNAVVMMFVSNLSTGIFLTFAVGILMLFYGIYFERLNEKCPKFIKFALLIGAVVLTLFVTFLYIYGSIDNVDYEEDAVIVLGAGIRGEKVGENLKNRLDAAVDYHSENPNVIIAVSGGQGRGEDITEALAMERYLIEKGIPKENIIKEERSTSTAENFSNTKKLLDEHFGKPYRIALITNDFHICRAEGIAKRQGFENATHLQSRTPWYSVIPNGLRETLAIAKFWVFG